MINETGTMTGGGGKPRGGKICLGSAAPRALDTREAAAELAVAEGELAASTQVQLRYLGSGIRHNCMLDTREAAAELAIVEGELAASTPVRLCIREPRMCWSHAGRFKNRFCPSGHVCWGRLRLATGWAL